MLLRLSNLLLLSAFLFESALAKTRKNPFGVLLRRSRTDVNETNRENVKAPKRRKEAAQIEQKEEDAKLDIPFDDYGGRERDLMRRGMGRRPPRPVCLFTTKTLLDIVTVTQIVSQNQHLFPLYISCRK